MITVGTMTPLTVLPALDLILQNFIALVIFVLVLMLLSQLVTTAIIRVDTRAGEAPARCDPLGDASAAGAVSGAEREVREPESVDPAARPLQP